MARLQNLNPSTHTGEGGHTTLGEGPESRDRTTIRREREERIQTHELSSHVRFRDTSACGSIIELACFAECPRHRPRVLGLARSGRGAGCRHPNSVGGYFPTEPFRNRNVRTPRGPWAAGGNLLVERHE